MSSSCMGVSLNEIIAQSTINAHALKRRAQQSEAGSVGVTDPTVKEGQFKYIDAGREVISDRGPLEGVVLAASGGILMTPSGSRKSPTHKGEANVTGREAEIARPRTRGTTPIANTCPSRLTGARSIFRTGPAQSRRHQISGRVGGDISITEACGAHASSGSDCWRREAAAGDLSKVEALKLLGMVNAVPGFTEQPKVINGCSDLFVEVLGDRGRHARSAVGMGSLPGNIPVEIEVIMRIVD